MFRHRKTIFVSSQKGYLLWEAGFRLTRAPSGIGIIHKIVYIFAYSNAHPRSESEVEKWITAPLGHVNALGGYLGLELFCLSSMHPGTSVIRSGSQPSL